MVDRRDRTFTRRLIFGALPATLMLAPENAHAQRRRSQNGLTDMAPTVLPNDIVRLESFDEAQAQVGDIVVYMHYEAWEGRDFPYMKRILALPGQRIAFREGVPILDGVAATSDYLTTEDLRFELAGPTVHPGLRRHRETLLGKAYETYHSSVPRSVMQTCQILRGDRTCRTRDIRNAEEVSVPSGHLFVVGDNRDVSEDSRWDGPIAMTSVRRRAVSILASPVPERVGLRL
jgi:signal peptidase I